MNCCLTKQKLLIELMHLRVRIDLTMSIPTAQQKTEREARSRGTGMKSGRKWERKIEKNDVRCTEMNTQMDT